MKPLLACVFLAVVVYGVCKKLGIGKADRFVLDQLKDLTERS